jgi:hypothetical protein
MFDIGKASFEKLCIGQGKLDLHKFGKLGISKYVKKLKI